MKSDLCTTVPLFLASCILLAACSNSSDGMPEAEDAASENPADPLQPMPSDPVNPMTPPQEPIEDPAQEPDDPVLFFKAPYLGTRNSGNSALNGFDLELQMQVAIGFIPDGTVGSGVEAATVSCQDGGSINVAESFDAAPNTRTTVRDHVFNDCVQDGRTVSGSINRTIEQFGTGAAGRTTTTSQFNLDIAGVNAGQGSLTMSGSLTTQELIEFATPSGCPPANTLSRHIVLDDGSRYEDPINGIAARYTAVDSIRTTIDRFVQLQPTCEVAVFVRYNAEASGEFDNIAAAPVTISKNGVYSANGILDSDTPAVFTISASDSQSRLTVAATGDDPMSVQVDIVDLNAIQSFTGSWDFAD